MIIIFLLPFPLSWEYYWLMTLWSCFHYVVLTIFGSIWEEGLNTCSYRMRIFCILFGKIFSETDSKTFRFTPRRFDSCKFYLEFQFSSAFGKTFKIGKFAKFCTSWGKTKIWTKGGKSKLKLKNNQSVPEQLIPKIGIITEIVIRGVLILLWYKSAKNWRGKVNMFLFLQRKPKF